MTAKELLELDKWLAAHVMEYAVHTENVFDGQHYRQFRPTVDQSDAMLVLAKCAIKRTAEWDKYCPEITLCISAPRPEWDDRWIIMSDASGSIQAEGDTLPLAICFFAMKLFSE